MRTVTTTKELCGNIEQVWDVMTDRTDLSWRGDLAQLQVIHSDDGDVLVETLCSGLTARFLVTKEQPPLKYEQVLTGTHLTRSWGFTLAPAGADWTRVTLEERYRFKNRLLLFLSYLYLRPKDGQKAQLKNLAAKLDELAQSPDRGDHITD